MNLRIILADDHPFVLLGVRAMLARQANMTVVGEALTPTSLLELLHHTPCDVLITDLCMPDACGLTEDGLQLVRRVRADWPHVQVVVVTTLTHREILAALLAEEGVSVISKGESMPELGDAIRHAQAGVPFVGSSIRAALALPPAQGLEAENATRLSDREIAVVRLVVNGQTVTQIASALGWHRNTVSRQKRRAMAKLGVTNDPGLFAYVRAHQILNL